MRSRRSRSISSCAPTTAAPKRAVPYEFLAAATLNNRLGWHESFGVTYAGAFETEELQYVALAYDQVLNAEGLAFFADASFSWGDPGTSALEALDFRSESIFAQAGLSYPLIRSRERNLSVSALLFLSDDQGDILSEPSSLDRLRGVRVAADFDDAQEWGGITQISAVLSQGFDGLGSTSNDNPDASREAGRVDFTKLEIRLSETMPLAGPFSVRLAGDAQVAFTPLLAPEECGYGGREFGRAFDPSELTGDHCLNGLAELRLDIPAPPDTLSQSQLYAFVDHGEIFRIDPAAGTPDREDASSAGIGVRLAWRALSADLSATKPIDRRGDDGINYFFVANARF